MKKIMLAIGHKKFEEILIKQLKDKYDFTGIAPYREAIVSEAMRSTPDIIVIRENLEGLTNMTDIIYSLREKVPTARIVFIALERPAGDEFLATLVAYGVYDLLVGTNIKISELANLINTPNTFGDVSLYATKVTVDEKGNKKVFDTKIIQAPVGTPVESQPRPSRIIPTLPMPSKKREQVAPVIDEEIPLTFIKDNRLDEAPGELRTHEDVKSSKNIKFDEKFYAPDDYLTKTSKPIKLQAHTDFKEEPAPKASAPVSAPKEAEFDFEIVDEFGNPINDQPVLIEAPKPVIELTPAQNPEPTPQPEPVIEEPKVEVEILESVAPAPVADIVYVAELPGPMLKIDEMIGLVEKKIEEDDLLSFKKPQEVVEIAKSTPLNPIEAEPEPIPEKESSPIQETEVPFVRKNKYLNGYPLGANTETLLFVRTEEFAENHTSLNIAIKLAKDEKKVLYVECAKEGNLDCFAPALSILKSHLTVRKMELSTVLEILAYAKSNSVDYIVIDSYMGDNLNALLMLNAKRFILVKQNKPRIRHLFAEGSSLATMAKFAMLLIEEYTEFGISPKVLMNDYQPFGVMKVKDKKETNFYAINAKMPAMLSRKNVDTLEAYRDVMNYIYGTEDVANA